MKTVLPAQAFIKALALSSALLLPGQALAARAELSQQAVGEPLQKPLQYSSTKNSWAIAFDNDFLVPGSRDQDYTYGINYTYTGDKAREQWLSTHQPLAWLDLPPQQTCCCRQQG